MSAAAVLGRDGVMVLDDEVSLDTLRLYHAQSVHTQADMTHRWCRVVMQRKCLLWDWVWLIEEINRAKIFTAASPSTTSRHFGSPALRQSQECSLADHGTVPIAPGGTASKSLAAPT